MREVGSMVGRGRVIGLGVLVALGGLLGAACGGGSAKTASAPAQLARRAAPSFGAAPHVGGSDLAVTAVDVPRLSQKVIKTATLSLQVSRGTLGDRLQEATLVASRHGGFVSSSETVDGKVPSAMLVLRIPSTEFEGALGELRGIGRVERQHISGQDVTAQFVDLQARLRNWQAQEVVLLRLMAKSTSITDSLRVQNQLQDVQLQIEEIEGQLRVLNDQTALSTITLALSEPSAAPAHTASPSFARAWSRAVHGIGVVLSGMVVAAGYLAPFGVLALIGMIGWAGYRRIRRPVAPTA
jgi:hypothetical protein